MKTAHNRINEQYDNLLLAHRVAVGVKFFQGLALGIVIGGVSVAIWFSPLPVPFP